MILYYFNFISLRTCQEKYNSNLADRPLNYLKKNKLFIKLFRQNFMLNKY